MNSSRSCFLRSLNVVLIALLRVPNGRGGSRLRPGSTSGTGLPLERLPRLRLGVVPREGEVRLRDGRMVLRAEVDRPLEPLVVLDAVEGRLELGWVGRAGLLDQLAE